MILDCGRTDFNIFQCWDISEKLIFFFCFDDNGKNGFKLKKNSRSGLGLFGFHFKNTK
jgi:hypothetical protein